MTTALPSPSGGNDTTAIQAVIDASGGDTHFIATGAHIADGLRIDGSGGNLSGNVLEIPVGTSIAANANSNNNIITALSGSGHAVVGRGRLIGSKSNGGSPVRPPSRAFWLPSTAYAVNDTVEVSASDTQTTAVLASNLVYKCTSAHTSASTFIANKATKWTLVSDPNFDDADLSYAQRNGVYFGNCTDFEASGIKIQDCVYAALNLGSGPVQPANIGGYSVGGLVEKLKISSCENGLAGGRWQDVLVTKNRFWDLDVYGVVLDDDADGNTISQNFLIGKSGSINAIFEYKGSKNIITPNQIRGPWLNGIIEDQASDSIVTANMIRDFLNVGIFARNSPSSIVAVNSVVGGAIGIQGVSTYDLIAALNSVRGQSGANIEIDASSLVAVALNILRNAGSRGLLFNGSIFCNSVGDVVADAVGPGIEAIASSNLTITGVTATDTRSGASKTQTYGVKSDSNSNNIVVVGSTLTGNKTAARNMSGSGHVTTGNKE